MAADEANVYFENMPSARPLFPVLFAVQQLSSMVEKDGSYADLDELSRCDHASAARLGDLQKYAPFADVAYEKVAAIRQFLEQQGFVLLQVPGIIYTGCLLRFNMPRCLPCCASGRKLPVWSAHPTLWLSTPTKNA